MAPLVSFPLKKERRSGKSAIKEPSVNRAVQVVSEKKNGPSSLSWHPWGTNWIREAAAGSGDGVNKVQI